MRYMRYLRHPVTMALVVAPALALGVAFAAAAGQGTTPPKSVPPERVPAPPAAAVGATHVGDQDCVSCQAAQKASVDKTLRGKAADSRTPSAVRSCETCHGPGSKHVDDPS